MMSKSKITGIFLILASILCLLLIILSSLDIISQKDIALRIAYTIGAALMIYLAYILKK